MGVRAARLSSALAAVALAACGGGGHSAAKGPPAVRVCTAAAAAASSALGDNVQFNVTDKDPANIECALSGAGVKLALTAQASSQAYTAWNTATTHFEQAFGAFGHTQHPQTIPGVGMVAQWFPAQQQLLTTNGSESRGGSFVTVAVVRWGSPPRSRVPVVGAVAKRVLAVAPRGPNPGPPPS
jgi:hypothetical protein